MEVCLILWVLGFWGKLGFQIFIKIKGKQTKTTKTPKRCHDEYSKWHQCIAGTSLTLIE